MNEYFQLDFRSNAEVLPNTPEDTISLRRETVPGLVLAASLFCVAYGDCTCSLWHWRNGAIAEDAVIGLTVSEFIETYGKGMVGIAKKTRKRLGKSLPRRLENE